MKRLILTYVVGKSRFLPTTVGRLRKFKENNIPINYNVSPN